MSPSFHLPRRAASGVALLAFAAAAPATVTFDFETTGLGDHASVSGDTELFVTSTAQASSGSNSLRFDGTQPVSFRSFTYDLPIDIETGTVSVWFYDTVGAGTGGTFAWRGSIILEDANNPADFGAVEIADLPYGGSSYYGSEGENDLLVAPDTFESGTFGTRSVGWHEVVFAIAPAITTISVNGNAGVQVAAPGSSGKDLRLRFMADSASVGGSGNWTAASTGFPAGPGLVYVDDITFTATAPAAANAHLGFEDGTFVDPSWTVPPEYDVPEVFMTHALYDEPNMQGFINTYGTSTDQAHEGTNAATFIAGEPALKSFVVDLAGGSPGTITVKFYDALGEDFAADKIGGAVILEDGSDPADFIAAEIWNFPYPGSTAPPNNYYFTARPVPAGSGFYSSYFPARSIGWHTLTVELAATYSRMQIDGVGQNAAAGNAVYDGPGLDSNPKLRIMGDSPTLGGFSNWADPGSYTGSIDFAVLYLEKSADYVYFDDISVPLPGASAVPDWAMFE